MNNLLNKNTTSVCGGNTLEDLSVGRQPTHMVFLGFPVSISKC